MKEMNQMVLLDIKKMKKRNKKMPLILKAVITAALLVIAFSIWTLLEFFT